jgi:lipoprotein-anchoring transpeptidase ErfK/SrfK
MYSRSVHADHSPSRQHQLTQDEKQNKKKEEGERKGEEEQDEKEKKEDERQDREQDENEKQDKKEKKKEKEEEEKQRPTRVQPRVNIGEKNISYHHAVEGERWKLWPTWVQPRVNISEINRSRIRVREQGACPHLDSDHPPPWWQHPTGNFRARERGGTSPLSGKQLAQA